MIRAFDYFTQSPSEQKSAAHRSFMLHGTIRKKREKKKLGLNHGFGKGLSPQKLVAPNYPSENVTVHKERQT